MINLIIIPARAGSKRLKNKNKRKIGNLTLVEHTIIFAKKLNITPYILISTNDKEILNTSLKHKILTPWLRPSKYSTDKSKSIEFTFHAIDWFKKTFGKLDNIILLQPTSPFRSVSTFKKMYNKFKAKPNSILTVSHSLKKGKNNYLIKNNELFLTKNFNKKKNVCINGNIYINSVKNLLRYKNYINKKSVPFLLKSKKEIIDIDHMKDFILAKKIFKKK